ncbi:MAG: cache domain-containing protein [Streptosporangiales bacterium]|nr:cache domain-containing protein [Streptosporangiales bacterium]
MTESGGAGFRQAREAVTRLLDDQLVPLTGLAERFAGLVPGESVGQVTEKRHLAGLLPGIEAALQASDLAAGLGFAAAPGVVEDRDHYLLWLQKHAGGVRRLSLNLAPGDPDLYDYHDTEWFSGAQRLGAPAAYGPYVDYAGADLLVVTIAVPVLAGGRFAGVAGTDLLAEALEHRLIQLLRPLPGDAVLVAPDRSVIAAGTPRWMPGERLAVHPARDAGRYLAVETVNDWTGWVLALADATT